MSVWTNIALSGAGAGPGTWVGAYTNLTDGSTGTTVKKTSLGAADALTYPVTDVTIPSNEVIDGVRWRCQMSRPSFNTKVSLDLLGIAGARVNLGQQSFSGFTSTTLLTGPWVTQNPQGTYNPFTGVYSAAPLTQSDVNAATVRATDSTTVGPAASTAASFMELGLDLATASVPTVAVSSPSGVITDNLQPPIVWAHSDYTQFAVTNKALTSNVATLTAAGHTFQVGNDVTVAIGDAVFDGVYKITAIVAGTSFSYARTNANVTSAAATGTATIGDGAAQASYEVKVFTAAQYGAAGFDPSTSTPAWSTTGSTSTGTITPATLPNSTTLRAYVRTTKVSPLGRVVTSAWAFTGFSTVATPPPAPAVTSTYDALTNRCAVVVQNGGNLLSANDSTAEGGVGGWTALTNMGAPTQSATVAFQGTQSVRMSSTAAGTMTMRTASGTSGVAVIAGQAYSVMAQLRAGSAARTCRVGVQFYAAAGAAVGGIVYGTGVANATGSWTALTLLTTAPATAAFASVVIEVQSTAAGAELHYADAIGLAAGGASSSPNLIANDPSFEGATVPSWISASWIGSTASTPTLTATNPQTGSQALLVTLPTAATNNTGVQLGLTGLTIGATYTLSVQVRVAAGSPRAYLRDIFGVTSGLTYTTRDTGATTNAYVRLIVTFTATATTHYFAVANDAAATAAQTWNVDAVQLELGSSASAFSVPGPVAWSPGGRSYAVAITRTQGGVVTTVRGASALTPDATGRVSVLDYEAVRGQAVTYTATVTATATGAATTSAVGVAPDVTVANDGRYWLKAVAAPAINMGGIRITGTPTESREENLGVFRLDGRTDTVVVAGQTFGDDVDFTVATTTAAEFEAVKALAVHQGTLLLQEPFVDSSGVGLQRWVRVIDRSWTRDGVPAAPRSIFTLKAVAVGKGYS